MYVSRETGHFSIQHGDFPEANWAFFGISSRTLIDSIFSMEPAAPHPICERISREPNPHGSLVGGIPTILKNHGVRQWVPDDNPYMKWKKKCLKPPISSYRFLEESPPSLYWK